MKIKFVLILLLTLSSFCTTKQPTVVTIQPLGKVSNVYIEQVEKSVKSFYGYDCKVLPSIQIKKSMLTKITKRIDANKALRKSTQKGNLLILTEKDICYFKDNLRPEYGIFGLGLRPGKTCIISTFRLRTGVSHQKTLERLEKVALHEIGHNLGLKHCKNHKKCMMNDANGTIKQVDKEKVWFCERCKMLIKNKY
jgi:archaemetzincin